MKFRLTNKPNRTLQKRGFTVTCLNCGLKMSLFAETTNCLRYSCGRCEKRWSVPTVAQIMRKTVSEDYYSGRGSVEVVYGDSDVNWVLEVRTFPEGGCPTHVFVSREIWNSLNSKDEYNFIF